MSDSPRPQDLPLQADVRRLGALLGRTIGELAGESAFDDVETLRALTRARRGIDGDVEPDAQARIAALIDSWGLARANHVVRAFALYFQLVNTAEQTHRVRRRRHYQGSDAPPQRGSLAAAPSPQRGTQPRIFAFDIIVPSAPRTHPAPAHTPAPRRRPRVLSRSVPAPTAHIAPSCSTLR